MDNEQTIVMIIVISRRGDIWAQRKAGPSLPRTGKASQKTRQKLRPEGQSVKYVTRGEGIAHANS